MKKIKIKTLGTVEIPKRATDGSAGLDVRANLSSSINILPGETFLVPTGFFVSIEDKNVAMLILPRSSLAHKNGITLSNSPGLVDSDYQGEVFVSLKNLSQSPFTVNHGDRIAQLMFVPVVQTEWELVDSFEPTNRGDGGFGSTGKS